MHIKLYLLVNTAPVDGVLNSSFSWNTSDCGFYSITTHDVIVGINLFKVLLHNWSAAGLWW